MTAAKTTSGSPLDHIKDAFLDNILETSEADLREEFVEEGRSPDEVVALMKARLAAAHEVCAQARMSEARAGLAAFRKEEKVVPLDLARQRERLAAMRSRAPAASGMMMAARKGEGLSERDEEGLLEDLADLERLSKLQEGDGEA
jgi:hypothetical protein